MALDEKWPFPLPGEEDGRRQTDKPSPYDEYGNTHIFHHLSSAAGPLISLVARFVDAVCQLGPITRAVSRTSLNRAPWRRIHA